MTTDADKVRFLAELAIGRCLDCRVAKSYQPAAMCNNHVRVDYPHSLDTITRDLLPLLREREWEYMLSWNGSFHRFMICKGSRLFGVAAGDEPARAAFEAIWEALKGGQP